MYTKMQYQREDRVKVQLKVNKPLFGYPGRPGDYYVAVTGSGLQLGYSDPKKAPRCQPIGHNLWVKDIWQKGGTKGHRGGNKKDMVQHPKIHGVKGKAQGYMPGQHRMSLKNSDINFKFLVVNRCNGAIVDVEKTRQRHLSVENKPISVEVIFNKPRFTAIEIDEQISIIPPDNKKTGSDNLSNKALLEVHLKMRCQPKYTLSGNNATTKPEHKPPFMNKLKDGPASTLEKGVECIKQEEEVLKADKQLEERDTTLTLDLTNRRDEDTLNVDLMQKDNKTPNTAEIVQMNEDMEQKGTSDTKSTTSIARYFPCIDRKFLLAAAGVAAVSYVGYCAFFRK